MCRKRWDLNVKTWFERLSSTFCQDLCQQTALSTLYGKSACNQVLRLFRIKRQQNLVNTGPHTYVSHGYAKMPFWTRETSNWVDWEQLRSKKPKLVCPSSPFKQENPMHPTVVPPGLTAFYILCLSPLCPLQPTRWHQNLLLRWTQKCLMYPFSFLVVADKFCALQSSALCIIHTLHQTANSQMTLGISS